MSFEKRRRKKKDTSGGRKKLGDLLLCKREEWPVESHQVKRNLGGVGIHIVGVEVTPLGSETRRENWSNDSKWVENITERIVASASCG